MTSRTKRTRESIRPSHGDAAHAKPTAKKRKVIPFAIPSRGDSSVGSSEAMIPVVVTTESTSSATVVPAAPPPTKTRAERALIRQQQKGAEQFPKSTKGEVATHSSPWTPMEDKLLKQYYEQGMKWSEISMKLQRSIGSCSAHAIRLGFGRPRSTALTMWTTTDDELLKKYYKQGLKYSEISKNLGRPLGACSSRAAKLGLVGGRRRGRPRSSSSIHTIMWTPAEDECRPRSTAPTTWTPAEDELLKKYYKQGLKYSEISKNLGRSLGTCSARAAMLGLVGGRRRGRPRSSSSINTNMPRSTTPTTWTPADDELLKKYYKQGLKYSEISKNLGRPLGACSVRAAKLGLVGGRRRGRPRSSSSIHTNM